MTKDAIKAKNIPMDLHRGSSREVASGVGQQAEEASVSQQADEVETVSQQTSETAGAGAQHDDSTS